MTLHIFNPEHDISLANGMRQVTPPHAARELGNDLSFLPALWAKEGDIVLVEDEEQAKLAYKRATQNITRLFGIKTPLVTITKIDKLRNITIEHVDPWGWDYSIYSKLLNSPCTLIGMPTREDIQRITNLSHRRTAAGLLPLLRCLEGTTGEAKECDTIGGMAEHIAKHGGNAVLKAPWSSSGRGVRFITSHLDNGTARWVSNIFTKQKSIMIEPLYKRIADFGMEFVSRGDASAEYLGLSLFSTTKGAYTGNVIATEARKREMIGRYVDTGLLDKIKDIVCSKAFSPITANYKGPFGIDMMIVNGEDNKGFLLHPCVEINLRRTMGHLALCLTPKDDDIEGLMQVVYEGRFKLRVNATRS